MLKIAALAPMPSASVRTAMTVNAGLFQRLRSPYHRSLRRPVMGTPQCKAMHRLRANRTPFGSTTKHSPASNLREEGTMGLLMTVRNWDAITLIRTGIRRGALHAAASGGRRFRSAFEYNFCKGEIAAVGDGECDIFHAHFFREFGRLAAELQRGLAACGADDFDIAPADTVGPAGAEGFHRGFLGGEASGVTLKFVAMLLAVFHFGGRKEAFEERRAVARDGRLDAIDFSDVQPEPDDQSASRVAHGDVPRPALMRLRNY